MRLLPRIRWRWVRKGARRRPPVRWRSTSPAFYLRARLVWPWQPITGDMMTRVQACRAVKLLGDVTFEDIDRGSIRDLDSDPSGREGFVVWPRSFEDRKR